MAWKKNRRVESLNGPSTITCPDCGKRNKNAMPDDRCLVCGGMLSVDFDSSKPGARRTVGSFFEGLEFGRDDHGYTDFD